MAHVLLDGLLTRREKGGYHPREKNAKRERSFPFFAPNPSGWSSRVRTLGSRARIRTEAAPQCHPNTTRIFQPQPWNQAVRKRPQIFRVTAPPKCNPSRRVLLPVLRLP